MSARTRRQIGYGLLGAVLLVIGVAGVQNAESDGAEIAYGLLRLAGGIMLLVNLGRIIIDLIRAKDD